MKKILSILLVVALVVSLAACGDKTNKKPADNSNAVSLTESDLMNAGDKTQSDAIEEIKSRCTPVEQTFSTYNKENSAQYYKLTCPDNNVRDLLYGHCVLPLADFTVLIGRSSFNCTVECNSVKDIYKCFVGQWEAAADDLGDYTLTDHKFTMEKSEVVEINDFSMCRYEGAYTYNINDFDTGKIKPYSCYFVAYGTQLSEGGYVYWIVLDDSQTQSLKPLVDSIAEDMAKSLEETTIY